MSSPNIIDFDPGDPQGDKHTSTAHDHHDAGKVRALEGKDGTNLKKIGAKTNKNNENGQINTGDLVIDKETEDKEDAEEKKITKEELE